MDVRLIKFNLLGDKRGALVSLEQNKNVPFKIRRVYYVYGTKKEFVRGKHAHTSLKQLAVCVSGHCTFLLDDGKVRREITLDSPQVGLYIGNNIWREMYNFSENCVIVVLANKLYDEDEYIRDYEVFLNRVNTIHKRYGSYRNKLKRV